MFTQSEMLTTFSRKTKIMAKHVKPGEAGAAFLTLIMVLVFTRLIIYATRDDPDVPSNPTNGTSNTTLPKITSLDTPYVRKNTLKTKLTKVTLINNNTNAKNLD